MSGLQDFHLKDFIYRFWVRPAQNGLDALGQDSNLDQNQAIISFGLAIKSGGASPQFLTTAGSYTIGNSIYYLAAIAANSFSAATPVLGNNQYVIFQVIADVAGVITTQASSVGTAAAGVPTTPVVMPQVPLNKAVIGLIRVATAVTTFTPGTTNLDAASTTVTYINGPLSGGAAGGQAFPRLPTAGFQTRSVSIASLDNPVPEPLETLQQP